MSTHAGTQTRIYTPTRHRRTPSLPSPRPSPTQNPNRTSNPARYGTTAELLAMLDEHLQWQEVNEPPKSEGEVIVDWDGTGVPKVQWRREEDEMNMWREDKRTEKGGKEKKEEHRKPLNFGKADRVEDQRHQNQHRNHHHRHYEHQQNQHRTPPLPLNQRTPLSHSSRTCSPAPDKPLPPLPHPHQPPPCQTRRPTPQRVKKTHKGLTAIYHPAPPRTTTTNPQTTNKHKQEKQHAYITALDTQTNFQFSYDGKIIHVHRSLSPPPPPSPPHPSTPSFQPKTCSSFYPTPTPPSIHDESHRWSNHSSYFALNIDDYQACSQIKLVPASATNPDEKRDKGGVVRFVEKVLLRLEGWGMLAGLRREGRGKRGRGV